MEERETKNLLKQAQGDLALLGLAIDWYVPLKAAQEELKKVVTKANLTEANREELARTRTTCLRAAKKLRLIIDLCEDAAEDGDANAIQLHEQIEQVISKVREKAQSKETRNRNKKTKAFAKDVSLAS